MGNTGAIKSSFSWHFIELSVNKKSTEFLKNGAFSLKYSVFRK